MSRIKLCFCATVLCLLNLAVETTDGLVLPKSSSSHTCVIGAGISGLAAARYLQEYGVNFTVFEATPHIGGTWYFDERVGTDDYGVPLFTSMYKYLRTNTPRQTMEFAGFPMPEGTPTFPSGTCYYKYLELFVRNFDLMKNIRFRKLVTSVTWAEERWNVTYRQTDIGDSIVEGCDYVIIANGHYTKPVWPKIEAEDTFKGKIIHSQDYRDPEPYRNRRVLIVGAGPSGLDLVSHLLKLAAKVVHSHHLVYNQPPLPKIYIKKPDIKMFTSNGVIFNDGSFEEVDDVIYCTGYDFDHSFLEENSGVTATEKFILPLYQHMVNIRYPTMLFIGITRKTITRVNDAEAQYAASLAAGKFSLPSREKMWKIWLQHVLELQNEHRKILDVNLVGDKQDQYFANLTAEAGVTRGPPVLTAIRDQNAIIRLDNFLNYRDYDINILDDYHFERKHNPRKETCPITL